MADWGEKSDMKEKCLSNAFGMKKLLGKEKRR